MHPGEHLPFRHVVGRVAPHGMGLALGGVGYSVLATFVTLFYASRHWNGAALCLTAFGLAFIAARLLFIHTINRFGGFPVAIACLSVESLGMLLLWLASSPWMAFTGAELAVSAFRWSFPPSAWKRSSVSPINNRGAALGVYTAFADVSFFLTAPGRRGYRRLRLCQRLLLRAVLRPHGPGNRYCSRGRCRRSRTEFMTRIQAAGSSAQGMADSVSDTTKREKTVTRAKTNSDQLPKAAAMDLICSEYSCWIARRSDVILWKMRLRFATSTHGLMSQLLCKESHTILDVDCGGATTVSKVADGRLAGNQASIILAKRWPHRRKNAQMECSAARSR